MRTLRRLAWAAIVTVVPVAGAGAADSATVVGQNGQGVAPAPSGGTVRRLSKIPHGAAGQVQLGRLAALSAQRPETSAYGARLAADFQALDSRITAKAVQLGVDPAMLAPIYAGENTASLARESEDLTRLGAAAGD